MYLTPTLSLPSCSGITYDWLKGVLPVSTPGLRKIYAEEITDQAFDALHDLAMDIDASTEEDY